MEVIDNLVYYLVKSVCFIIIANVVNFLNQIQLLQNQELAVDKNSFVLCKPGLVQLFQTLKMSLNYIHRLKNNYIAFDDKLNRISQVLEETKVRIKSLYRDLYKQFTLNFAEEIEGLLVLSNNRLNQKMEELVKLHVAVGVSLLGAFINVFRKESRFIQNI